MTDRELMQQALAVLQKHVDYYDYEHFTSVCELEPAKDLILALRERLAQPQRTHWEGCEEVHPECKEIRRREWVGLTDEDCVEAIDENFDFALDHGNVSNASVIRYARAIEAKLKEKNA